MVDADHLDALVADLAQRVRCRHRWHPGGGPRCVGVAGMGDKRIKMVGIDHDQVVLKAIKDGFVNGTMLQNPYGQGYVGSYALDKLRSGCKLKDNAPWKENALTKKFRRFRHRPSSMHPRWILCRRDARHHQDLKADLDKDFLDCK